MSDEMEVAVESQELSLNDSLKAVLKTALVFDGLRRGLHECAKALDRGAAHLCILSQDCDNDEYTRLIKALCAESKVPIIMADSGTDIGEWVGLAKLNPDGTVRKAVRCSVAVVTDFGSESQALTNVLEYVKNNA